VDPGLPRGGQVNHEVTMSSMQFGDAQVPAEGHPAVPLQPVQPLQPPQPAVPAAPAPEAASPVPAEPAPAPAVPVGDMRDVPLGTLVFRAGLLPEERLEEALQEGMRTGKRLGEILLERAWVSETDLGRLLAGQKGLPFVELDPSAIDPTAPPLLHPEKARLHGALPIGFEGGVPVVAVTDPSNDLVIENVRRALACEPVLVVAGRDALYRAIHNVYGADMSEPAAAITVEPEPIPAAPVVEPQAAPVVEVQVPAVVQPVAPPVVEPAARVEPVAPEAPPSVPEPAPPVVAPIAVEPVVVEPVVEPVAMQPAENGAGVWLGQQPAAVEQPAPSVQPAVEVAMPEPVVELTAPAPVIEQPAPPAMPGAEAPAVPAEPEPFVPPVAEPEPFVPPVAEPEPFVPPVAEPEAVPQTELTWAVLLRLADGERLEVGSFPGEAEAIEGARAVVAQAASAHSWPFFAGRFIRPEAIVSIDLVELEVSRWLGSSARAAALGPQQQPTA
jgi:hypothetical protein